MRVKDVNWIKSNVNDLKNTLELKLNDWSDLKSHRLTTASTRIQLYFISTLCNPDAIHQYLVMPWFELKDSNEYQRYLLASPKSVQTTDEVYLLNQLLHGYVAIFLETDIILFDAGKTLHCTTTESHSESVTLGPSDSLVADLESNLNSIRHQYIQASLNVERRQLGTEQAAALLLFDSKLINPEILTQFKASLNTLYTKPRSVQFIYKDLMSESSGLFPTVLTSDRIDRIVKHITAGKLILLIQGYPDALIAPTCFFELMAAMEDDYQLPVVGFFLTMLKYIGLFTTIFLPGIYIGLTSYNPELISYPLAMSIAGSRINLPYQPFVEIIIMLLTVEALSVGTALLPRGTGLTATIVGGLIFGVIAVQSGLASNPMIITVFMTVFASLVIPTILMNYAVRISKYLLIALTVFFGMIGVTVGAVIIIFYLANLRSFGQPFLQLFPKHVKIKNCSQPPEGSQ